MTSEVEAIKAEYEVYLNLCNDAGLTPVPLDTQFSMLQALWALGPLVIPYVTANGTIWVHDTRHKTKQKDRPFAEANMAALVKAGKA